MAAEKGPFLTSCIIFYLSVGAAIFQILEEPNWVEATARYVEAKKDILKTYPCLTTSDLDHILEVVSDAAGEGVSISGDKDADKDLTSWSQWGWGSSVIFAATIVTTIGYGNVAPKTSGGRIFTILYGLCGIPLCLVWISELGSFFGDRAKRLSQVLIRKGLSVRKVQVTCTALFLLWGLMVHLLIPPLVFMSVEGWSYLEGLYFSFITLTTVGFGDYVAGVNPQMDYPRLYRIGVELWIYMGLAWLSLFFSWNVHMVVSAHKKVMRKRRHRHQQRFPPLQPEQPRPLPLLHPVEADKPRPSAIDIFNFLSEEAEDYSSVIRDIGEKAKKKKNKKKKRPLTNGGEVGGAKKKTPTNEEEEEDLGRSKSCSDILALDHSPRSRRHRPQRLSISQVFISPAVETADEDEDDDDEGLVMEVTQNGEGPPPGSHDPPESHDPPPGSHDMGDNMAPGEGVAPEGGVSSRFTVSTVTEENPIKDQDENG